MLPFKLSVSNLVASFYLLTNGGIWTIISATFQGTGIFIQLKTNT